MEDKWSEKSRRERRNEARLVKKKNKFDSWVQHQRNKSSLGVSRENVRKLTNGNSKMDGTEQTQMAVSEVNKLRNSCASNEYLASSNTRMKKISNGTKVLDKTPKTKFFDYLLRDMEGIKMSAADDLAIERRLAKKLKVKNGTLGVASDDLDNLLEGIPSFVDSIANTDKVHRSVEENSLSGKSDDMNSADEDLDDEILSEEEDKESDSVEDSEQYDDVLDLSSLKKANGKTKKTNHAENIRFEINGAKSCAERGVTTEIESVNGVSPVLAPETEKKLANNILGKYVAPHLRSHSSNESAEYAQVRNRLRGFLNRLSETNLEGITREISTLFHSVGRSVGCHIITEEVVASCSGGPRGNEQYAAVFAAFVAGMSCLVGIDFGAKLLARLAKCFEEEHMKEDNVSLRNVTLLLCYLYVFGLCSSELMYDFLIMLGKRLTEVDVSTVLTVLQCCWMKLRGDDPIGMKNFISSVQHRASELKDSSRDEKSNVTNKRFMIETICDIKNNKKRSKEDNVQRTRINKWLQKLRVEDVLIRGLTWSKLLDPGKKGQWWLSGEMASTNQNIEEFASSVDKEVPETVKMLDLAASQWMNTDARRAIFGEIMSSEDYLDAFEKLLRLDLRGKQDRGIMRVLVECCLQEKVFNKYYCILASKLCSHDKNHKFTLQYCLWDHFKELESKELIRSVNLSKFTAEMIASFSLSLAVLKAVDLNDPIHLSPKRIMHFHMLFEALFELSDKLVWNIFTRIAATPEYEPIRSGIEFFVSRYVVTSNKSLANKFKIARKALRNVEASRPGAMGQSAHCILRRGEAAAEAFPVTTAGTQVQPPKRRRAIEKLNDVPLHQIHRPMTSQMIDVPDGHCS